MTDTQETIELKYGTGTVGFTLPDSCEFEVLNLPNHALKMSEHDILDIRLRNPMGTPRLDELLSPNQRILIIVPDKTRVSRLDLVFPKILEAMERKKISDTQVTILFSNGSHPYMTEEEKIEILGSNIYYRFKIVEHNCRDAVVEKLGNTSRGTQVVINPLVKRHDRIIVISPVVHHYFAGFGGGPKMIMPGLASLNTIWQNHRLSILSEHSPLHPGCEPGNLKNNPVYEDIVESVKSVNVDFAIQLVLDEAGNIADVFCGNLNSSFQKACMKVQQNNVVPINELADVVIASAGGFPRDINFIQAHKSIHFAARALKPNGSLILLAECQDGYGNPEFLTWFQIEDYQQMKEMVMENYQLNANTAISLKHKLDRYNIYLVSELPDTVTKRIGFEPTHHIHDAIEKVFDSANSPQKTYLIPNASILLPELQ